MTKTETASINIIINMNARSIAILNNCEIFTLDYTSLYKHESKEKECFDKLHFEKVTYSQYVIL